MPLRVVPCTERTVPATALRPPPDAFHEQSRTLLSAPASLSGNARVLRAVNCSYPAYANKRIYARNHEEIISASLAAP